MMNLEFLKKLPLNIKQIEVELAKRNFTDFILYTFPNVDLQWFHKSYYGVLNEFAHGRIKKLMIFIPPQHGKSEASTRRLPPFLLGHDPTKKIAVVSYSAPKARKFNREIQRVIDTDYYHDIFPKTTLSGTNIATVAGGWLRNADECEIVSFGGGFKTVGVGGALTGEPVDVLIMDDLYKDAMTAWSATTRQNVKDWYDTVADTRLHNDSQQLIVYTRWHEDDLAGILLRDEAEDWVVVVYKALKEGPPTEADPRLEGEALWPKRHSVEKLLKSKKRNPHVFESLYQQNPKPAEGLMYGEFKTYDQLPDTGKLDFLNYTDTADTGKDYLCSISYIDTGVLKYVQDIVYTQEAMEKTEPETADLLMRCNSKKANIESNNGGRGFARSVASKVKGVCMVGWFHQSKNKETRIFTNRHAVSDQIVFPSDWYIRWPIFHRHVTNYMAQGKNEFDDCSDVLTGIVEIKPKRKVKNKN